MRARPDQGHLAAQHVDQLRQLVQAGAAQPASDRGDPRVVGARLHEPRAGVVAHGAELQQLEHIVVEALARLAEQGGTGRVQPDRDRIPTSNGHSSKSMRAR